MTASSLAHAIALIESGHASDAVDMLSEIVRDRPDHVPALYLLGHALEELSRWSEASRPWLAAERHSSRANEPADVDRILADMQSSTGEVPITEDLDDTLDPSLSDYEVVTETWARILAAQQNFSAAANIYEKLAAQHPDRASRLLQQARRMREKAGSGSA